MSSSPESGSETAGLPFSIDVFGGLGAAEGLLRLDGEDITVEFLLKDEIFEVLKSRPRAVRIPLGDIESVTLRVGLLTTSLELQARTLESVSDIPGSEQGRATLEIARKNRSAARRFVASLADRVGERACVVDRVERWADRRERFLAWIKEI